MIRAYTKQALVVVSSACAGFYLGGRYVGGMATQDVQLVQPEWIGPVQDLLWIVLVVGLVSALVWVGLDHQDHAGE